MEGPYCWMCEQQWSQGEIGAMAARRKFAKWQQGENFCVRSSENVLLHLQQCYLRARAASFPCVSSNGVHKGGKRRRLGNQLIMGFGRHRRQALRNRSNWKGRNTGTVHMNLGAVKFSLLHVQVVNDLLRKLESVLDAELFNPAAFFC